MPDRVPHPHLVELGRGTADDPALAGEIRRVTDAFRASGRQRVVLHFLNEFLPAADVATAVDGWRHDYATDRPDLHPIFFGWDGSLVERIGTHLAHWAKDTFLRRMLETAYGIVRRIVRFVLQMPDPGRGISLTLDPAKDKLTDADVAGVEALTPAECAIVFDRWGTADDWAALEAQLHAADFIQRVKQTDPELYAGAENLEKWVAADRKGRCPVPLPPETVDRLTAGVRTNTRAFGLGGVVLHEVASAAVKAAWRARRRYKKGTHHGLWPTIVEEMLRELSATELGVEQRDGMRKRVRDVFVNGPGADLTAAVAAVPGGSVAGVVAHGLGIEGAGAYLRHIRHIPTHRPPIKLAAVAPTVSLERMSEILDWGGPEVAGVLSLGLDDRREREDHLHANVYPLSVLYFACGVFEHEADFPYAGMQRFHDPAAAARIAPTWEWSPKGPPPTSVVSHKHWGDPVGRAARAHVVKFL
ncbi:MAG TPA: hypothetical protein VD866_20415 [Urbifossiella sp.]|nr:hypothetical protein [Urbifossiella sp.]